jgi:hypothetical protein
MSRPVITINESSEVEFERHCEKLVASGYKLVTASCGFADSEKYDYCGVWMAVFALPEVIA